MKYKLFQIGRLLTIGLYLSFLVQATLWLWGQYTLSSELITTIFQAAITVTLIYTAINLISEKLETIDEAAERNLLNQDGWIGALLMFIFGSIFLTFSIIAYIVLRLLP